MFREELRELLARWHADIQVCDYGQDYCPDERMELHVPGVYDGPEHAQRDAVVVDIGTYLDGSGF